MAAIRIHPFYINQFDQDLLGCVQKHLATFGPLNQFNQGKKDLLAYAERNPVTFGICTVLVAAGLAVVIVPPVMGFGAAGPVAGGMAAAWQGGIGNVAAGSLFALLQAMAMNGTLLAVGGGLIGVGVVGLAVRNVDWAEVARGAEWAGRETWARAEGAVKNVDWAEVVKSAECAGRETLAKTEEAVRSVDWAEVVKSAECAGRETLARTEGAVKNMDWAEVVKGAKWAGRETLARTEGAAKSAEWAGKEAWTRAEKTAGWAGIAKRAKSGGVE